MNDECTRSYMAYGWSEGLKVTILVNFSRPFGRWCGQNWLADGRGAASSGAERGGAGCGVVCVMSHVAFDLLILIAEFYLSNDLGGSEMRPECSIVASRRAFGGWPASCRRRVRKIATK